jgi:hypothetical protein
LYLSKLVYMTMKSKVKFVFCLVLFYLLVEFREISLCLHILISLITPIQRIIQLQEHSPISLSPQVFHNMLKIPKPTLSFKGEDCKDFLKKHDNGLNSCLTSWRIMWPFVKILSGSRSTRSKTPFGKLLGCSPG